MTTTMTKKCLFGGALFAAGLAVQANAQLNVDQVTSFTQVFGSGANDAYAYGNGNTTVVFVAPLTGIGSATLSNMGVMADLTVGGVGYGVARAIAFVTVDVATPLSIAWDFSDVPVGGLSYAYVGVYDLTNSVSLFSAVDPSAGLDTSVTLQPGIDYVLTAHADSDAPSVMFASITAIPAPGSLALLALGGMTARRRRRRR